MTHKNATTKCINIQHNKKLN